MFNSKTIRPYKGRLIELTYQNKIGKQHKIVGEIVASVKTLIVLNVNKTRLERPIYYNSIIEIKEPEKGDSKAN